MATNTILEFAANEKGERSGLNLRMANRHGLISGATGTGKTVTLQTLAERFSKAGVPVFLADVKGDLAGISRAAAPSEKIVARVQKLAVPGYAPSACPVIFWDVFGKFGHPIRATVSEMGPILLSRLLGLNETQQGVLELAFHIADDEGLLLLDMKDLRAMLQWAGDNASDLKTEYGNISPATVGAIQRSLLNLSEAGGDLFFGEPAVQLKDLMKCDFSGNGVVSILDATQLMQDGRIYSTFLLWLLSELFEQLPEVGDADKPKLVFFFDEAHLLFTDTPKSLVTKIEQVVRLVRSKGVGIYFVSQSPLDLPESVLGQLGNRVQHALRAYTPADQKAVRAAADTFRPNPAFSAEEVISTLGVGEALVSTLNPDGSPTPVERAFVYPPQSRIGVVTQEERGETMSRSPIAGAYEAPVDRESASEMLLKRREGLTAPAAGSDPGGAQKQPGQPAGGGTGTPAEKETSWMSDKVHGVLWGSGRRQGLVESAAKSFIRSIGSNLGRQVMRGVLGGMTKRR